MDDDIDAAELLHHGACDRRTAFDSGNIRSNEYVVRRQGVRPRPRGGEHRGAGFAQPRRLYFRYPTEGNEAAGYSLGPLSEVFAAHSKFRFVESAENRATCEPKPENALLSTNSNCS
jgi:hypothetical protein